VAGRSLRWAGEAPRGTGNGACVARPVTFFLYVVAASMGKYTPAIREYYRKWMAARRSAWFAGKCCAGCGSAKRLQLDHVDPKTKVSHRVWSWSDKRRLAELAKCQILCYDCHLEKTIRFDKPHAQHGSARMYNFYGCRCNSCRARKSKINAARTRRRIVGAPARDRHRGHFEVFR
jgi:hypothetical protein